VSGAGGRASKGSSLDLNSLVIRAIERLRSESEATQTSKRPGPATVRPIARHSSVRFGIPGTHLDENHRIILRIAKIVRIGSFAVIVRVSFFVNVDESDKSLKVVGKT
jgi:hypothetical protein